MGCLGVLLKALIPPGGVVWLVATAWSSGGKPLKVFLLSPIYYFYVPWKLGTANGNWLPAAILWGGPVLGILLALWAGALAAEAGSGEL